jgi:hypothetical protein
MPNRCYYCKTIRPASTPNYPHGTKLMIIRGEYYEFCEPCGNDSRYGLVNIKTAKKITLAQILNNMIMGSKVEWRGFIAEEENG